MMKNIYKTITMPNSLSPKDAGKFFEFSFTKKQYYRYLLSRVSWGRVAKTALVVAGIIGFFTFRPLFFVSGYICIALDLYALIIKKMHWVLIPIYLFSYLNSSWLGVIYVSFTTGIINLLMLRSFLKSPCDVEIDKNVAKKLVVI